MIIRFPPNALGIANFDIDDGEPIAHVPQEARTNEFYRQSSAWSAKEDRRQE